MKASIIQKAIENSLSPDLLKGAYKKQYHPLSGYCYIVAEALYHLLNVKEKKNWQPTYSRTESGTHWWLQHKTKGYIADITSAQFSKRLLKKIYGSGKSCGFLTKEPSKRCMILIKRIKKYARNEAPGFQYVNYSIS